MIEDTLLNLLYVIEIDLSLLCAFSVALVLGLGSKLSRYWIGIVLGILSAIAGIALIAFVYIGYSNGMKLASNLYFNQPKAVQISSYQLPINNYESNRNLLVGLCS